MIKILMIEDDWDMAELLEEFLAKHNMAVQNYDSPYLALSALTIQAFDLVILDLSLPEMDGVEVCRQIREKSDIPIIISSARADMSDKSACFYRGADDYLPKPYDSQELLLRIGSILRRTQKAPQEIQEPIRMFQVDRDKHEIRKNGTLIHLTNAEFEILTYFIKRSSMVVSREEILTNVEAINYESSLKSIDVMIGRIRTKIEEDSKAPQYLVSIRGLGYKLLNE